MKQTRTALHVYSHHLQDPARRRFQSVVSLHSHSSCSREKLAFIPGIARQVPVVRRHFDRCVAKYKRTYGRALDFSSLVWRPPLAPAQVIDSECEQAHRRFDRPAIVSLSDHDTLEGPLALRAAGRLDVPLSFEWSVLYKGSMFHLGLHGISPASVEWLMPRLAAHTSTGEGTAAELLDALSSCPDTVVVLNHPCWDMSGVGRLRHDANLLSFMRHHGNWIHALELNGYRTWTENRRVLPLAQGFGLPVVGGGDRHGYMANAIVNLSAATTFEEFAYELRAERASECVVLPEYEQPFASRVLETACGILRPDPRGGGLRWEDRVFATVNGVEHAVTDTWTVPLWVDMCVSMVRALGSPVPRRLFALTHPDGLSDLESDCCPDRGFGGSLVGAATQQPPVAA